MAQLVFTITADTLASSVQLVQGELRISMQDAGSAWWGRPVTRLHYAAYTPVS